MEECFCALATCAVIASATGGAIFADYNSAFATVEEIVEEAQSARRLLKT